MNFSFKIILQVNQFKVRPPDKDEMKPPNKWENVEILPKAENPENVKPVLAKIQNDHRVVHNDQLVGEDDQLVGEDDQLVGHNDRLVGEIVNETGDNEKGLILDPHTTVAAEDILKVLS